MKELKSKFDELSKKEKMAFVKEIMPEICRIFDENPQDIMPYCKDMMRECNMDMSMMMNMMNGKK